MREISLIAGLSVIGVMLRYGIGLGTNRWFSGSFPWTTFGINLTGSFLIGLFSGYAERQSVSEEWRMAIMVGLLGGFTTFSTFSFETLRLYENGDRVTAAIYLVLSPILSVILCFIGRSFMR
ncbi:MAG: CrcB family protein [Proteobacteria bacterium]|nr:MAG: CrcB family protein [Pseudomonadota bacterium]